jgi:hypothetical protein
VQKEEELHRRRQESQASGESESGRECGQAYTDIFTYLVHAGRSQARSETDAAGRSDTRGDRAGQQKPRHAQITEHAQKKRQMTALRE